MPSFVVLREGLSLDDDVIGRVRKRIREDCSPRHVPNEIVQIAEVPRTLSGKALEAPVKRILMGLPAEQAVARDALINPAALDVFIEMALEAPVKRILMGLPAEQAVARDALINPAALDVFIEMARQ
jgi:acetoacetyl-CoA synthetase